MDGAAPDVAPGVIRAIEQCFPRGVRQRCLAHKLRNLRSKVPDDAGPEFQVRPRACYQAASLALARVLRDDIVATCVGWQSFAVSNGAGLRKLDPSQAEPPQGAAPVNQLPSLYTHAERAAPAARTDITAPPARSSGKDRT